MKVEEKHLTLDVVLSEADMAEPEPSAGALQAEPSSSGPPAAAATASRRSLPDGREPSPTRSYTERRQAGRRVEQEASQFTGFAEGYSAFTREYGKTLRFGASAAPPPGRQRFRKVKHHSLIPSLDQRDASLRAGSSQHAPPLLPPLPADGHTGAAPASSVPPLPNIGSVQQVVQPGATTEGTTIASAMKRRRRVLDDDDEDDSIEYADTIPVRPDRRPLSAVHCME